MIFCCPECPEGHSPMCIKCPVRAAESSPVNYKPEDEECPDESEFLDSLRDL